MAEKKPIGKILLRQKAVEPEVSVRTLAELHESGRGIFDDLTRDTAALKELSQRYGVPGIDLSQICLPVEQLEILPREIAEKYRILPIQEREDCLFVAMVDPRERAIVDELEFVTGKRVYPYVAPEAALDRAIEQAYECKSQGESHYIGSRCPPALLQQFGASKPGTTLLEDPSLFESRASDPQPPPTPGVVVDDRIGRASRADEIEEQAFGETSPELSVVTDLNELPVARMPGVKTVLVVDDDPDIRKLLARLLTQAGHRVLTGDRGKLALRLVKEHIPDLILLDAMLPEIHGFDIARRIKHSERYKHIPIIIVSAVYRGWRYAEDLRQSYGVEYFIEKPFRIAEISSAVDACLRSSSPPPIEAKRDLSAQAEEALSAGVAAYRTGDTDLAIQHLKRGVSIDPLAFRLHFHLGLLFGKRGLVFEAIAALEQAVATNGKHFPSLKNLAILYQKAGFKNRAIETWERALAVAPEEATRQSIRQNLLRLL